MGIPRGIRGHNPLNIRRTSGTTWNGQAVGGDPAFVTFTAPEYGIRAAARVLQTYQESYGINTLSGVIQRWAPSSENDTSAYIMAVEIWSGIQRDATLDLASYETVLPLLRAMTRMENGAPPEGAEFWYPLATWERGLRLAGVSPSKPLADSRTMKSTATAAAGGVAAAGIITDALNLPDAVAELLPVALTGLSDQTLALVAIAVSVAASFFAGYARTDDKLKGRL